LAHCIFSIAFCALTILKHRPIPGDNNDNDNDDGGEDHRDKLQLVAG